MNSRCAKQNKPRLAYVLSTSFSGSTLLSMLLNRLDAVCTVGEAIGPPLTSVRPTFPCSCGATLLTCEFWSDLQRRIPGFDPLNPGLAFYDSRRTSISSKVINGSSGAPALDGIRDQLIRRLPAFEQQWHTVVRRNVEFARAILSLTHAEIFLDSSKSPIRLRRLLAIEDLDVSVIHLIRSPLGFAASNLRHHGVGVEKSARIWNKTLAQSVALRRLVRGAWVQVIYESLAAAPEMQIDRIAQEFRIQRSVNSYANFRHFTHHIIGNTMRLGTDGTIAPDLAWSQLLSSRQRAVVLKRTSPYAARAGLTLG
jgi:hypothetical protein